ncbi:radical SAM protein [Candidatus Aminicenantes bacterium AC-335-B20]|jgi:pyruvate formate lyase activating enzyme|nr:radical SAM protein [SCandidatus Aminicenantes bacterium Aminicenantia_JdfR_composite]MCP2596693.1 radical SAM protein [Candidatus Aminicenantes bacterium AC-335-G13]MCP2598937.1 radical SAM protein [Candidatus Aminicenantes bacterium AC-335-B20]
MAKCINCGQESILISKFLNLCAKCIKEKFEKVLPQIRKIHAISHERFGLPAEPPKSEDGIKCDFCINECIIGEGEKGYCGLRKNDGGKFKAPSGERGNLSWYYDSLPTNCVGDWVCPGGTGAGYPKFSYSEGPEYGYKNLAVFYHGCSFNCLFCQNWHFREYIESKQNITAYELASAVDSRTSCICYFGGDPTPQLSHAIKASRLALKMNKGRILRICWETNGSMNQRLLKKMLELSLESGGCVKFDLKAWNENLHIALCGVSNRRTLENFAYASEWIKYRKDPPLLIASTLLVPGYVDENEVYQIAKFIADLNPEIPYSLLGFYPHFYMPDLPTTSRNHAQKCREVALKAGLKKVKIGNIHLLGNTY